MATPNTTDPAMFTPPPGDSTSSMRLPLAIGGAVVLVAIVLAMFLSRRAATSNTLAPLDAYAPYVIFSQVEMSEATSPFAGGRSTYVDGHVSNAGDKTLSDVTVQAIFKSFDGQTVSLQSIPLTLIRTRQPYVDTQPVSAQPIVPKADVEFRLIFEGLPGTWNQQQPELHVTSVKFEK